MSRYPQNNVNNDHQLIRRQNTYVLDRKLVTIHSEDRDISKWPNANHFEIRLPETLNNVESMRLVQIELPGNQYVFSNSLENTKLQFFIRPNLSTDTAKYLALETNKSNPYVITIQEGFYTPSQMVTEIENLMNNVVSDYLKSVGVINHVYNNFTLYYDSVGQKIYFGNTYDSFSFNFTEEKLKKFSEQNPYINECITSNVSNDNQYIYTQYANWGLPFYLGFEKKAYTPNELSGNESFVFNYNSLQWLSPDTSSLPPSQTAKAYYIVSSNTINMFGDSAIYMEIDKYNTIDEIDPYSTATNNKYKNDYHGRVNSAFAKIPITAVPESQIFDSRNGFLQNVSQYFPPIKTISKLKFKFRYHDGRLVEFKDNNFNFTIAMNQLRDEMARDYVVRIPADYTL